MTTYAEKRNLFIADLCKKKGFSGDSAPSHYGEDWYKHVQSFVFGDQKYEPCSDAGNIDFTDIEYPDLGYYTYLSKFKNTGSSLSKNALFFKFGAGPLHSFIIADTGDRRIIVTVKEAFLHGLTEYVYDSPGKSYAFYLYMTQRTNSKNFRNFVKTNGGETGGWRQEFKAKSREIDNNDDFKADKMKSTDIVQKAIPQMKLNNQFF